MDKLCALLCIIPILQLTLIATTDMLGIPKHLKLIAEYLKRIAEALERGQK